MKSGLRHRTCALARYPLALFLLALVAAATPLRAGDDDVSERVRTCFEGSAAAAADKAGGNDEFSRSLAAMTAGKQCEAMAAEIVDACLAGIEAADDDEDGAVDYYPCIGIVANPCIDSAWASNEFRSVVCAGTEEKVWLDRLHGSLDRLRATLDGERRERLEAMQRSFFEFRNEACGLVRMLREGREPDLAYGACTTEAAARFAIDLKDMVDAAAGETEPGRAATETRTDDQAAPPAPAPSPPADGAVAVLGSEAAPVRADGPGGQRAYLRRLRCPDGAAPSFERLGSMGYGGYGHIVDRYRVECGGGGATRDVHMDMYFPGFVESEPVEGFTLAAD